MKMLIEDMRFRKEVLILMGAVHDWTETYCSMY